MYFITESLIKYNIRINLVKTKSFENKCLVALYGLWEINRTFNNILVILRWSVLLVEETGVPGENKGPATSHRHMISCITWPSYFLIEIPGTNILQSNCAQMLFPPLSV